MSKKKKDWKTEKERLENLSLEERRKEYRRSEVVRLNDIPAWSKGSENKEQKSVLSKIALYKGDITLLEVDAIVNAANTSLLGGGGVDGCIHKAAGPCLYDECKSLNGCDTGDAKITCGYDLPAKYVIHTVGPIARGVESDKWPETEQYLKACYTNSLDRVMEKSLRTVAFPCISTGIYGFPNKPASEIALNTVTQWVKDNYDQIERVIFCVFLDTDHTIYREKLEVIAEEEKKKQDNNLTKQDNPECEDIKDNDVTTRPAGKEEDDETETTTLGDTTPTTKEEVTPIQTDVIKESSSNNDNAGPPGNDNKEDELDEDSESQTPEEHVQVKDEPNKAPDSQQDMELDQPTDKNKNEVDNKKGKEDGKSKDKLDPITDEQGHSQEAMDVGSQKDKGGEPNKAPDQQDMELDQPTALITTTSPLQGFTDAKMDIDGGVQPDLKLNENKTSTSDRALFERNAQDDNKPSPASPDETPPTEPSIQY